MNGSGVLILGSKSSESTVFRTPREHISPNTRTLDWQNHPPNTECSDNIHLLSSRQNRWPDFKSAIFTATQCYTTCYQAVTQQQQQSFSACNKPLTNEAFADRESADRCHEYVNACNKQCLRHNRHKFIFNSAQEGYFGSSYEVECGSRLHL
jgi:hypothetical protein